MIICKAYNIYNYQLKGKPLLTDNLDGPLEYTRKVATSLP